MQSLLARDSIRFSWDLFIFSVSTSIAIKKKEILTETAGEKGKTEEQVGEEEASDLVEPHHIGVLQKLQCRDFPLYLQE